MFQNGLMELVLKLGLVLLSESDVCFWKKEQEFNYCYLVDFVSEVCKVEKSGFFIFKWELYVKLLLNLVGFDNWEEWKEVFQVLGFFLLKLESVGFVDCVIVLVFL